MAGRTHLIKVSDKELKLLQDAQELLKRRGFDSARIPKEDEPEINWQDFALGAVAGIGAYLLYKSLTGKK
jgi:hypothetical protein